MQFFSSYLRWHDEQIATTITHACTNHPLGLIRKFYTHDILSLFSSNAMVVKFLIFMALSVFPSCMIMVWVTSIENTLIIMCPGYSTKLDFFQFLFEILIHIQVIKYINQSPFSIKKHPIRIRCSA